MSPSPPVAFAMGQFEIQTGHDRSDALVFHGAVNLAGAFRFLRLGLGQGNLPPVHGDWYAMLNE